MSDKPGQAQSYDRDVIAIREALHFGTLALATDNGMRPNGVHLIDNLDRTKVVAGVRKVLSSPGAGYMETFDEGNLMDLLSVFEELGA